MAKISASEIKSCVLNEVGYLEKRSNYMLDNKTANAGYNNYTKYTRDIDYVMLSSKDRLGVVVL